MTILAAILAATPSPTPTLDPAETFYSPGTIGFLLTFFVAGAAVLLIFDMVRRVRRVRYRAEIQEKLAAEASEAKPNEPKPNEAKAPKPKA
jgi:hypothetical protein